MKPSPSIQEVKRRSCFLAAILNAGMTPAANACLVLAACAASAGWNLPGDYLAALGLMLHFCSWFGAWWEGGY